MSQKLLVNMEAFLYRKKLALIIDPNQGSEAHGIKLGNRTGVKWVRIVVSCLTMWLGSPPQVTNSFKGKVENQISLKCEVCCRQ